MKKFTHAPSVQVARYKCCEQQHHRNELLQKQKAPVIANEGFVYLVARGGVEPGSGCLIRFSRYFTRSDIDKL